MDQKLTAVLAQTEKKMENFPMPAGGARLVPGGTSGGEGASRI